MTGLQSRKRLGMNLKCFFLIHVLIIYNHWFVGIKFSVGWIFLAALLYHETLAEFHNVPLWLLVAKCNIITSTQNVINSQYYILSCYIWFWDERKLVTQNLINFFRKMWWWLFWYSSVLKCLLRLASKISKRSKIDLKPLRFVIMIIYSVN